MGAARKSEAETAMATIGIFKTSGDEYLGEIITLQVQAKNVRIVPEANRSSESAPSHRVYVGRAEIGAAWTKTPAEGRPYLTVKLDDPSFSAPIFASLIADENGDTHTLTWIRASPKG